MWRHNHVVRQLLHPCAVRSEHVQRVGIEHYRAACLLQLRHQCERRTFFFAKSRSDANGLKSVGVDSFRVVALAVDEAHSLWHSHLHDAQVAVGRERRHLSCAAAHARLRCEYCSARHAATSGYEQRVAHRALVGEVVALQHLALDVRRVDGVVCSRNGVDEVFREANVERAHLAQILLAVGEEHCELLRVQRQRHVGSNYGRVVLRSVALGHESRRDVDAHYLRRRLVDVAHERSESARERLLQSRTEESVHNERLLRELRRLEVRRNLGQLVRQSFAHESVAVLGALLREMVMDVEQENVYDIAFLGEQSRHGESVAAVVARTCEHYDRRRLRPSLANGVGDGFRRPLHKVYG